ncbi:MAG: AMP-binding protein [Pseudomonadales bacterium]
MTQTVPDLNFGDLFEAVATAFPERTAIVFGELRRSWRELDQRSNRLARALAGFGLEPDSKVAFYLRNSPAYVELFAACAKGRFVHANVNYRYVDHELYYLLDNADAEAVVYDAEFRPHVAALRDRLPKVRAYLEVGEDPVAAFAHAFEAACSRGDDAPLGIDRSGDDLYFMYTGGTTGYPKAVMWPAKARIAAIGMTTAQDVSGHIETLEKAGSWPVALPAAPMMHSTGLTTMMATMVSGGTVVILPSRSFDAEICLEEIERNRVMRMAIVGDAFSVPLLRCLREHPGEHDLASVALISSAGAMWSEQHKQALLDHFPNAVLADSLGSSEGSRIGAATTRRGETGSTGRFELGPDVKVFREDFTEVTPGSGEAGMLAKAGPLPLGYYKDPERTAATFPTIGGVRYSLAGDWCRIESDGTMTLLGRGNNCINTGGEKVYPEEVEDALKQMPQVIDAAVLGVPDERWGQAVAALLRTQDDRPLPKDELRAHLDRFVARYKHPRYVHVTNADFRHENGKINYRAAKKLLEDNLKFA